MARQFRWPCCTRGRYAVRHGACMCVAKMYCSVAKSRNKGKLRAVFSILKDKSIKDVIRLFVDIVDEWHISKINSARAMPTIEIINAIKSYRSDALIYSSDNLHGAYMNAYEKTSLNDNIVVFGSFYTVSECLIK